DRHNEANGEDNRDGHSHNLSSNHGVEGDTDDAAILSLRARQKRNLLATPLLAQGTPMLLAGDEFGHSQHGNNNAYCQDNELTWLNWKEANQGLITFTAALTHLRRSIPALTRNEWWDEGDENVRWLNHAAQPLQADAWQNGVCRMQILLSGRWLIAINATEEVGEITLPEGEWRAIPPFAGEDNPVVMAVWHGPAHGVCVFQKS
ncbi:MAG TPA: glycogen debranching enzyme, partial [Franconibacter helveticus]|nr:glycogen debranching enzyme [Franconibacter helveticus]